MSTNDYCMYQQLKSINQAVFPDFLFNLTESYKKTLFYMNPHGVHGDVCSKSKQQQSQLH